MPNVSRKYRKKKRARQEQETRRRITEAAVELHRTLGPAAAGVKDVAELAGVSRTTVYSHFPTEAEMFRACSTHWAGNNPFPDPAAWADIEDPRVRLGTALEELYRWYRLKRDMLEKVLRDAPLVPALAKVMDELWWPYLRRIVDALAGDRGGEQVREDDWRAALGLVVEFDTWKLLTSSGLDDARAARLAVRMAMAAREPSLPTTAGSSGRSPSS